MKVSVNHQGHRVAVVTHTPGLLKRLLSHPTTTREAVGDSGGRWYWSAGGAQIVDVKTLCALGASQWLWEVWQ